LFNVDGLKRVKRSSERGNSSGYNYSTMWKTLLGIYGRAVSMGKSRNVVRAKKKKRVEQNRVKM
jgi:hypothetical protein